MVRARVRVSEKTEDSVKLNAVYPGDPANENLRLWQATSAGDITILILSPRAMNDFELNKEYYVDFTPVVDQTQ